MFRSRADVLVGYRVRLRKLRIPRQHLRHSVPPPVCTRPGKNLSQLFSLLRSIRQRLALLDGDPFGAAIGIKPAQTQDVLFDSRGDAL